VHVVLVGRMDGNFRGGNPKISQPSPTLTFGIFSTSRRNARSESGFVL
jgi:hypothetical protein